MDEVREAMSKAIQGQVATISCKEWYDSKRGKNINLYSFKLEDDGTWYRTGTIQPTFDRGDSIKFTAQGQNVEKGSIQKSDAPSGTPAESSGTPPANGSQTVRANKGTDWAAKDKYQKEVVEPRITFMASRSQAVELVCAAIANDALSFGSTAKGKKLDMMLDYVDQVTDRLFLQGIDADKHLAALREQQAEVDASVDAEATDGEDY